ncbi:MAG: hypothetical protein OXQ29_25985 [Rhodospirillaceae bacterium]|nr:hypothetical protein [Rhodospirillaceae bacterium]
MTARTALILLATLMPIISSAQAARAISLIPKFIISANQVRYGLHSAYSVYHMSERIAMLEQLQQSEQVSEQDFDTFFLQPSQLPNFSNNEPSRDEIIQRMAQAIVESQSWQDLRSEALDKDVEQLETGDKILLGRAFYEIVRDLDQRSPCDGEGCNLLRRISILGSFELQDDNSWHLSVSNHEFKAIYDHFHRQRPPNETDSPDSIFSRCRPNTGICFSSAGLDERTVSFSFDCDDNTSITVSTGDSIGVKLSMGVVTVSVSVSDSSIE